MKLSSDLALFQQRLGHVFETPEHLIQALTHPSVTTTRGDNQRLEFLGDRVLGLVMAQALLDHDRDAAEGQLAPRFNALVRKETCADVARDIDLGSVMKIGRSEMKTGGRRKDALLGDAMEAVIAAIYLDAGLDAAQQVILTLWRDRITSVEADARDPKTALQEWAQARSLGTPTYTVVDRTGPDHAPVFTIQATLSNGETAIAKASSKRQAEQAAARDLLEKLT